MIQACCHRLAFVLLAAAAGAAPALADPLPPRLQQVLQAQGVPEQDVSIVVRDAITGQRHLELNADVPRSPASTIKVLTTHAVLDELGPAYTWTTRAYATGPIVGGRLQGDLVIEGGGDPYMIADRWWRFARELRNAGLKSISGNVVLDRTLYEPQVEDPDAFDGRGFRTYNVLPDPLLVNLQSVDFNFVGDGKKVEVVVDPEPVNLHVQSTVKAVGASCRGGLAGVTFTGFDDDPSRIAIGGRLSPQCPRLSVRRVVMDAPSFAFGTFASYWKQVGGRLEGGMKLGVRPANATPLLEFQSLSLGEIVRLVNKHSSNAMARTLLLTLGIERRGAPGTVAKGEEALRDWLTKRGLALPELVIDNGSGLSRATRISADGMAHVLADAYGSRWYPELAASLPLGGLDGSLRSRLADVADPSRVRLKTGQLNGVAAIAGWVVGDAKRPLSVVVFVNHPGAQHGAGQAIADAVVRWALQQ